MKSLLILVLCLCLAQAQSPYQYPGANTGGYQPSIGSIGAGSYPNYVGPYPGGLTTGSAGGAYPTGGSSVSPISTLGNSAGEGSAAIGSNPNNRIFGLLGGGRGGGGGGLLGNLFGRFRGDRDSNSNPLVIPYPVASGGGFPGFGGGYPGSFGGYPGGFGGFPSYGGGYYG